MLANKDKEHLLQNRKLALIVDLDQTLIHTSVDHNIEPGLPVSSNCTLVHTGNYNIWKSQTTAHRYVQLFSFVHITYNPVYLTPVPLLPICTYYNLVVLTPFPLPYICTYNPIVLTPFNPPSRVGCVWIQASWPPNGLPLSITSLCSPVSPKCFQIL